MNKIKKYYFHYSIIGKTLRVFFQIWNTRFKIALETGFTKYFSPHVGLSIDTDKDYDVTLSFSFIFCFYLSFNLPKKLKTLYEKSLSIYGHDREIRVSFHDYIIWWNFWTSADHSFSKTPKYRKGCFDIAKFLLGDLKVKRDVIEENQYSVYTDTGINNIILQKELLIKYRNRWYSKWYKFKYFIWDCQYAIIEDCTPNYENCFCRLKGTLKFNYETPKSNYEKLTYNYLKGAGKYKWNFNEIQGGSLYKKEIKNMDDAYLHLINNIYKDKLLYSKEKYKHES
jgi:hypothetical protein